MKRLLWIDVAIVLGAFAIGAYAYHLMPLWMPVHWGAHGADGYGSRVTGVFGFPLVMAMIAAIFLSVPAADPVNRKLTAFQRYYRIAVVVVPLILAGLYVQTLLWAGGSYVHIMLPLTTTVIIYILGAFFENSMTGRRNRNGRHRRSAVDSVGRRPVLNAGIVYKITAIIPLSAIVFKTYQAYLITIPFVAAFAYAVIPIYSQYHQERNGGNEK